jgi:hypothetical protein
VIEQDHEAKEPVNYVRLSDSGKQLIVDDCVYCGETHYHGAKDTRVAEGGRSHRGSHCHTSSAGGGYYLELADDADPPVFWYQWVGAEPPAAQEGGDTA